MNWVLTSVVNRTYAATHLAGDHVSPVIKSIYLGLAMLLLIACGGRARAGYTSQQQTVDGLTVVLERPQQIAVLQDYEFFVTLTDSAGKRVDGATVFLEQDMPAMKMNSNQPLGEPLGNGQYRLRGVFTMDGAWQLVVHASLAGKEYTARFEQQVRPQS
jgi:YtkA-like